MATAAISSHGTQLKAKTGGSYVTIGEVLDISGPGTTLNTEDATNHDSGGWREVIPTILEGGEVTFDINYSKAASQTAIRTAMTSMTKIPFQVIFPGPLETLSFDGYVTGFEYNAPVEGILRSSITILITGAITPS